MYNARDTYQEVNTLINLSELFPVEERSKTHTPELEMTQFRVIDTVYDIAEKGPLSFVITNRGDKKLTLARTADLVLTMPCTRCLDPVRAPFHLEIDQELDMNQSDEERVEGLGEQPYVNGRKLDIDQLVGNESTSNLPMAVLCSDDCKGIRDRCGTNLNHGTCDCDNRSLDPRMSVIQNIFKQSKEVQAMSIRPKNKSSKARRDSRRANWKASTPNLVKCSKRGALTMSYRVCKACGSYNKREIVSVEN